MWSWCSFVVFEMDLSRVWRVWVEWLRFCVWVLSADLFLAQMGLGLGCWWCGEFVCVVRFGEGRLMACIDVKRFGWVERSCCW